MCKAPGFRILLILAYVGVCRAGRCTETSRQLGGTQARPVPATAPAADASAARAPTTVGPARAAPRPSPTPATILDGAIAALESRRSVSARIRQEVGLFGRRLVGSGSYLELRTDEACLSRLELRIQLGQQTGSLVQVCDAKSIWTHRRLLDDGKLDRVDLARVERALQKAGRSGEEPIADYLGSLCGVGRLLRGLRRNFFFPAAQPGLWGPEKRPVWRLSGRWTPERLAEILPDQKEAITRGELPDMSDLPPPLPEEVVLLLGQADLFPYRVEFHRPGSARRRVLVTMDLYDVAFDAAVDPGRFRYAPGDVSYADRTKEVIESLRMRER